MVYEFLYVTKILMRSFKEYLVGNSFLSPAKTVGYKSVARMTSRCSNICNQDFLWFQKRIQNLVEHLRWNLFAKIVNGF